MCQKNRTAHLTCKYNENAEVKHYCYCVGAKKSIRRASLAVASRFKTTRVRAKNTTRLKKCNKEKISRPLCFVLFCSRCLATKRVTRERAHTCAFDAALVLSADQVFCSV